MVDVRLRVSPRWVRPVRNRERVRVHLASSEDLARVVLLDRDELAPGQDCLAQLRMETPLVPSLGDRFVVRSYSPMVAMAGGTVVDPHPAKHHRHRPDELEALARREGGGPVAILLETVGNAGLAGVKPKELSDATSLPMDEVRAVVDQERQAGTLRVTSGGRVVSADVWRVSRRALLEEAARWRDRHPLRWGPTREELRQGVGGGASVQVFGELLDEVAGEGEIAVRGERVRAGGGEVVFEGAAAAERDRLDALYRDTAENAPDRKEVLAAAPDPALAAEILATLLDQEVLVKLTEEIYYHRDTWDRALAAVREICAAEGTVAVGGLRDRLSISRKYAVPLLETMDARRITRRDGDVRVLIGEGS
jgi:selenocysteine-specific elongation factor